MDALSWGFGVTNGVGRDPGITKKKHVPIIQWLIGGLGPGDRGILGIYGPLSNNPFHKGIVGIQTTGPQTQPLTTTWSNFTVL